MNTIPDFPVPAPDSKFSASYWELTGDWFRQVGGQYLRTLTVAAKPDALDLADYLLGKARQHEPRGLYPGTGEGVVKTQDVVSRAEEVAAWLLDTHQSWHMPRFTREQAAKGGAAGKRPKTLLKAYHRLVQRLAETGEVLAPEEVARELGCHIKSVYRLIRQYRTTYLDLDIAVPTEDFAAEVISEIEDTEPRPDMVTAWFAQHPEHAPTAPDLAHIFDDLVTTPTAPVIDIRTRRPVDHLFALLEVS